MSETLSTVLCKATNIELLFISKIKLVNFHWKKSADLSKEAGFYLLGEGGGKLPPKSFSGKKKLKRYFKY